MKRIRPSQSQACNLIMSKHCTSLSAVRCKLNDEWRLVRARTDQQVLQVCELAWSISTTTYPFIFCSIQDLENLDFAFDEGSAEWQIMYKQLKTTMAADEIDPFLIAGNADFMLNNWCSVQRISNRAGVLSDEKIKMLDEIDFDWTGADALSWRKSGYALPYSLYQNMCILLCTIAVIGILAT